MVGAISRVTNTYTPVDRVYGADSIQSGEDYGSSYSDFTSSVYAAGAVTSVNDTDFDDPYSVTFDEDPYANSGPQPIQFA